MVLLCDRGLDDAIDSVPYAFYGDSAQGSAFCGDEVDPECGASLQAAISSHCVGRRRCDLKPEAFGDGHGCREVRNELRVRWTCKSDHGGLARHAARSLPPLPLRASGNVIVDADGQRVRMTGVSWAGAHIIGVPAGLAFSPIRDIAATIGRLGFNIVRFTFSTEMVFRNPVVSDEYVAANPHLKGRRVLDIWDDVIAALAAEGVMIWMDNHMLDSDWCCGARDCSGLWFNERYSPDDWVEMWRRVARRYGHRRGVVGFGLKNEPRQVCSGTFSSAISCNVSSLHHLQGGDSAPDPFDQHQSADGECVWAQWSDGPELLQYRPAVERAGKAVLAESPSSLVGVSGLHYSARLDAVAEDPVRLPARNLVYEAHDYSWSHPLDWEQDPQRASAIMTMQLDKVAGFILRKGIAPVLISEFGMSHDWYASNSTFGWFETFKGYVLDGPLKDRGGLDWMYWQLTSVQVGGTGRQRGSDEAFGVLNRCLAPGHDQHFAAIIDLGITPPLGFSDVLI